MLGNQYIDGTGFRPIDSKPVSLTGTPEGTSVSSPASEARPRLRVRTVRGFAVVDFLNTEVLLEEAAIRRVGDRLYGLIKEGRTRIVVNFSGVRYASCALLGKLVWLHRHVEQASGALRLCGLDPVLKDALRICNLDRVFEIHDHEMEALNVHTGSGDQTRPECERPNFLETVDPPNA